MGQTHSRPGLEWGPEFFPPRTGDVGLFPVAVLLPRWHLGPMDCSGTFGIVVSLSTALGWVSTVGLRPLKLIISNFNGVKSPATCGGGTGDFYRSPSPALLAHLLALGIAPNLILGFQFRDVL